ncbi:hypothetical protein EU245_14300 [Lentibacillus lipolyticus]|nr:hypothetical protein EU245_14300 [Lentibacillus lipolyticus]
MKKDWIEDSNISNRGNAEIIHDFLLSLHLANRSGATIKQYRLLLERVFSDFKKPITELSSNEIHEWIQNNCGYLKERTIEFHISVLSSFLTFCRREGYVDSLFIKKRWRPKLPSSIPKYLSNKDLAKTKLEAEKTTLRNRTILEFMLSSGCRVGEVHRLNKEDIDLENRTAMVTGKGKKIRYVHFSDTCAILFEKYLSNHPKDKNALFLTYYTRERLGIRSIQLLLNKIGEEAALDNRLFPHALRHTFATRLLSKGADLSFIAEELGHSNMDTTRVYAHLPKKEMVSLYRKYMG